MLPTPRPTMSHPWFILINSNAGKFNKSWIIALFLRSMGGGAGGDRGFIAPQVFQMMYNLL